MEIYTKRVKTQFHSEKKEEERTGFKKTNAQKGPILKER